jgi:hypothetical protein
MTLITSVCDLYGTAVYPNGQSADCCGYVFLNRIDIWTTSKLDRAVLINDVLNTSTTFTECLGSFTSRRIHY